MTAPPLPLRALIARGDGVILVRNPSQKFAQIDGFILPLFDWSDQFDKTELEPIRQIVRDWLTALNQKLVTSNKP